MSPPRAHVVETHLANINIPRLGGPAWLQCVHRLERPERGVSSNEASINRVRKRVPGQKRVNVAIVGSTRRGPVGYLRAQDRPESPMRPLDARRSVTGPLSAASARYLRIGGSDFGAVKPRFLRMPDVEPLPNSSSSEFPAHVYSQATGLRSLCN